MNSNFSWKSLLAPILTALLTAALVIGGAQLWIVPVLTEAQAEGRGAGVTRYNTPVQFLAGAAITNGLTTDTLTTSGATSASGALNMNAQIISNVGNAGTDFLANGGLTLANAFIVTTGGAIISGTVALDANEIGSTEIVNITRTVPIPLLSFFECTTDVGVSLLDFSSGADASPDFINSATNGVGALLVFDATGGSVDTAYVCSNFMAPQDYVSGGLFRVQATKSGETGGATEVLNCQGSINGAALGTAGTVTTSGTASASYTCTPTLTALAAGNSVSFEFNITSSGTPDDSVNLAAVSFEYSASQ